MWVLHSKNETFWKDMNVPDTKKVFIMQFKGKLINNSSHFLVPIRTNNTHNKAIRREISKQSNYWGILDKWYSSTNEEQYDINMKSSWFNGKAAIQRHTKTWSQLTMKYFSDNLALSTKCSCNIKEILNMYFWAMMR